MLPNRYASAPAITSTALRDAYALAPHDITMQDSAKPAYRKRADINAAHDELAHGSLIDPGVGHRAGGRLPGCRRARSLEPLWMSRRNCTDECVVGCRDYAG